MVHQPGTPGLGTHVAVCDQAHPAVLRHVGGRVGGLRPLVQTAVVTREMHGPKGDVAVSADMGVQLLSAHFLGEVGSQGRHHEVTLTVRLELQDGRQRPRPPDRHCALNSVHSRARPCLSQGPAVPLLDLAVAVGGKHI